MFTPGERLHEGAKTFVYRARRESDGASVIVKEWRELYPGAEHVARFRREYELLRAASGEGVIEALDFSREEGSLRLVMEDFGARSLEVLFSRQQVDVGQVLEVGCAVARALVRVHDLGIVHKDVTPANIVLNPDSKACKLIDFGIASTLQREQASREQGTFAGTPLYMSPEQTGRMNRSIDHRSDLYSLGATLYALLCGRPPFESRDRLALFHAHIARTPRSPRELRPELPESLSAIVLTLLSKRAEERYQTAAGLLSDLSRCRELWEAGVEAAFGLRQRDLVQHLVIPEKLYGREAELALLEGVLERVKAGAMECVFVSGYSGIGKTALISEVDRLWGTRGHLLRGKAEQYHRARPYAALIQAVGHFVEGVLASPKAEIEFWRERIAAAAGESARVLSDWMPSLGHLLGETPPLAEVTPAEAENRVHQVLGSFLRAMATPRSPLLLFLDDLQWADLPLLRLLSELALDPDASHFLLLGAFRDNEVDENHPLSSSLGRIRKGGGILHELSLPGLESGHVLELLVDTLGRERAALEALARCVFRKTRGNPFFLGQFLRRLVEDGLLYVREDGWHWQLDAIEEAGFSDDVVGFMAEGLSRLPEGCAQALQAASCIGTGFSLGALAEVLGWSRHQTQLALEPALKQSLIQPVEQGYWLDSSEALPDAQVPDFGFCFCHDRIGQAASEQLEPAQAQVYRLRLGRLLRAAWREGSASVFDVIEQLNPVAERLDAQEREGLVELNAEAGALALQSAAYRAADTYSEKAIQLAPSELWQRRYDFALSLYVQAALAAQLAGAHERMEQRVATVGREGRSVLDRMKAEEIRIQAFVTQNKYREGVIAALDALQELGCILPREPTEEDVEAALMAVLEALGDGDLQSFVTLPELDDDIADATRRILVNISSAAYLSTPHLLPLLCAHIVQSSLQHGVSRQSSYGFVVLGLVFCAVMMIDKGYLMGEVAVALLERWSDKGLVTRVRHVFNTHVRVFKDPVIQAFDSMEEVFQLGLAHGDLEYACWAAHNHSITGFFAGIPLEAQQRRMERYTEAMIRYQQLAALGCNLPFLQLVENLRGEAPDIHVLKGSHYDAQVARAELEAVGFRGALFLLTTCEVLLLTLLGRPEQAARVALEGEGFQDGASATLHVPTFYFFDALAHLSMDGASRDRGRIDKDLEKLRVWASFAPSNQAHRVALVEAELCALDGEVFEAMERFDQSIALAQEHGLAGELPLAYERAGRFYLARGKSLVARAYLLEARFAWEAWGAHGKAAHLVEQFPALLGTSSPLERRGSPTLTQSLSSSSTTERGEALDLESLLRASQTLSMEVRLDALVGQIMTLMIQNAGATRGVLLLPADGRLFVRASEDAEGLSLLEAGAPLAQCREALPQSLLHYVQRTAAQLVLSDASKDERFQADPCFKKGPVSVLCSPIVQQAELVAIVYLENDLTSGAFTQTRARMVELLGSQAAISLQNAQLYAQLEEKVAERTVELQAAVQELQSAHGRLEQQHGQLKEAQSRLIQSEKMVSLGTLVAGMSHELNNPVNYAHLGTRNLKRRIEQLQETLFELAGDDAEPEILGMFRSMFKSADRNLAAIAEGLDKIHSVVHGLRTFSRLDESEYKQADVLDGLRASAAIVQANYSGAVEVVLQLQAAPPLDCWPAQLNQAFMNILVNGCQAILAKASGKGTLTVSTALGGPELVIAFADDGVGMDPETRARIFEPFFTTRDVGEGVGLGLSIAFGIVQKHDGRIEVESEPGVGSTVRVFLPLPAERQAEEAS